MPLLLVFLGACLIGKFANPEHWVMSVTIYVVSIILVNVYSSET